MDIRQLRPLFCIVRGEDFLRGWLFAGMGISAGKIYICPGPFHFQYLPLAPLPFYRYNQFHIQAGSFPATEQSGGFHDQIHRHP